MMSIYTILTMSKVVCQTVSPASPQLMITVTFARAIIILTDAHGIFVGFSLVVAGGLSCPIACGIPVLQPGIKSTSPALEEGFLTTGPSGKFLK